jgi:hypothetical protein
LPELPAQGEKMRISKFAAFAAVGLALAGSALAVAQSSGLTDRKDRVNGYVDLKTGAFHPQTAASPNTGLTLQGFYGGIDVSISTAISADTLNALPKGYTILCDLSVNAYLNGLGYTEVASAPATVNGEVASCNVKMPYFWTGVGGGTASQYYFDGSYKITVTYAPGGDTQPLTDANVIRQTTGSLYSTSGTSFPLPASGGTTSFKLDARI